MQTELTKMLGIEHPVIQCGMANVVGPELVIAVCKAGGLGFLPTTTAPLDVYREQIRYIRSEVGNRPFGCNMSPLVPNAEKYLKIWMEEKVPVWGSGIRDPFSMYGIKKPTYCYYFPTVGSVKVGKKLVDKGLADAVITHGCEGGGHPGNIASTVLVPRAASEIKVPVIASGGFCDGRGLAAALALGADAVGMGTRFALAKESLLDPRAKDYYLSKNETDPIASKRFDGVKCNVIEGTKNAPYRGWISHPWSVFPELYKRYKETNMPFIDLCKLALYMQKLGMNPVQWLVGMRLFENGFQGDTEHGLFWSGQVVGEINKVETAADIVHSTVREAEELLSELDGKYGSKAAAKEELKMAV